MASRAVGRACAGADARQRAGRTSFQRVQVRAEPVGRFLHVCFFLFPQGISTDLVCEGQDNHAAEFLCPVCCQLVDAPLLTSCNHVFCLACLQDWMEQKPSCPVSFYRWVHLWIYVYMVPPTRPFRVTARGSPRRQRAAASLTTFLLILCYCTSFCLLCFFTCYAS